MRLRNLIPLLAVFFAAAIPGNAALQCDVGTADIIQILSPGASIPDGDWTFACRVKHNTGTIPSGDSQLFTMYGEDGWFEVIVRGTSSGFAGVLVLSAGDDDGTLGEFGTSGSTFNGNTNWQIIGIGRNGTTLSVIRDGTVIGSSNNANFDGILIPEDSDGVFHYGLANWEGDSDAVGVTYAGCFLIHRALSSAEWAMLNSGADFGCLSGVKFINTRLVTSTGKDVSGGTVINTGCNVATHPRTLFCGE